MTDERAPALTPLGNHALDIFMAAKMRACPTCRAEPGAPCYTKKKGSSKDLARLALAGGLPFKVRAHFHAGRYDAKR